MEHFHFSLMCMRKTLELKNFACNVMKKIDTGILKKFRQFQHWGQKIVYCICPIKYKQLLAAENYSLYWVVIKIVSFPTTKLRRRKLRRIFQWVEL